MSEHQVSGWAVGWTMFAAMMMGIAGVFQVIAGIAAIAQDEIYAVTPEWVLSLDVTTWGWIHLVVGVVLLLSAFGVMGGNLAARTVGVVVAALSAIANFAFIPYYPIWALVVIAIDVAVIWALTAHGRDLADTSHA
ncbi:DUF7144 family membrane protein [Salsipaludibacter albus]|uniref:DUF7144 family membrane protein n=1 Tax=Salsipaludibacter albus TaxID=2849650 RepID=UPI001EE4CCA9|nr:hypothetical protein [Salsipaludibacter albus]MBY5162283.1 hypothetical protein [Salsipaludibacter albus]